jgi:xanthine dehydrogenase accessory factor
VNTRDVEILRTATSWIFRGHRVIMGTVVHTWDSAPRQPGSLMIIRDDGQAAGSLSGGSIDNDLIGRIRHGELSSTTPQVTTYGANAEEARHFGLPFGESVCIVLEPLSKSSKLSQLLRNVECRRIVQRRLNMENGSVTLRLAARDDPMHFNGRTLTTVYGPRLRLLIIGAGELARHIASGAVELDYHVIVCDPREEYYKSWNAMAGVNFSRDMPEDLVPRLRLDTCSAVIVTTHDPKLDGAGLMEALRTPAFYVAASSSRYNTKAQRQRLLGLDLSEQQINALRCPAGLNLAAKTPSEIAISILAEITAIRRGAIFGAKINDWSASTTQCLFQAV